MILWFFCWNLRIIHHLTHPPKILFISIYKQTYTYTYTSRIFTWLWITDLFIFVDTWLKGICSFLEMGFWIKGEYHKKVGFFFSPFWESWDIEMAENERKMEGWLYLIRFNRFGLLYSRKRYFILEDNCLKSFKSIPSTETEVLLLFWNMKLSWFKHIHTISA